MPLESSDIALTIYVVFMIIALIISYIYGSIMIKKTGLFGSQTFMASAINFSLGFFAILGWHFHSWGINEFMFFGGLVLGLGMLIVSEAILLIVLFVKRKQMLQSYNENLNDKKTLKLSKKTISATIANRRKWPRSTFRYIV